MPQVGAFFVGLFGGGLAGAVPALGAAGTALAAGAAVTNFFTTTIVGRLLLSTGLSAVSSWIARRNAPKPPGLRRDSASQGDTVPQTFILGRFGTPGHWVAPEMSHGTDNKYLTYVLDLGDMPVNGLAGVFLNGEAVEFSGTVHPDYGQEIGGKYAGHAWVKFYDGTQTAADPMLLAKYPVPHATPWLPDMVGIGMPLAIWTFKFSRTVWQGFPVPTHDVDGISLYDLTKDGTAGGVGAHRWADQSTWEFATDPVSMIYAAARGLTLPDGRVWGGRYAESQLRYADWSDAIETCRDLVTVTTDGDPAEVIEPRYRAGFEVTVADEPASIIEELLKACCGKVADVGDALRIRVDGPGLPVYSFTESDILLDATASLRPVRPHAELVNSISASYPEPLTGYQPAPVPPLTDTDLETAHGERLTRAASFAAVPYGLQVQRIIAAELADHQRAERLAVMLPPDADMIEPLDTVTATLPSYNFAATDFEVEQVTHDPKTGAVFALMRVRDAVDYVVDSAAELQAAQPDVAAPEPAAIPVRSFVVAAHTVTDSNGADRRPALKLTWDVADVESVYGIEAEVRVAATATVIWRGTGPAADLGEWLLVEGIVPGVGYEVRARHLSASRDTTWTGWQAVTAPDLRIGFDDLQDGVKALAVQGDGCLSSKYLEDFYHVGGLSTEFPNAYYPIGHTIEFNIPTSTSYGWIKTLPSLVGQWVGPKNAEAYIVELEFTLFSGSLSGAGVRLDWNKVGGTEEFTWSKGLAELVPSPILGQRYKVNFVLNRPAGFDPATFASNELFFFGNYTYAGFGASAAKLLQLHSLQVYTVSEAAAVAYQTATAVSNIEGAIGEYAIGASVDGATSELTLTAKKLADGTTAASVVIDTGVFQVNSDLSLFGGLVQSDNYAEDGSGNPTAGWQLDGPNGAIKGKSIIGQDLIETGAVSRAGFTYDEVLTNVGKSAAKQLGGNIGVTLSPYMPTDAAPTNPLLVEVSGYLQANDAGNGYIEFYLEGWDAVGGVWDRFENPTSRLEGVFRLNGMASNGYAPFFVRMVDVASTVATMAYEYDTFRVVAQVNGVSTVETFDFFKTTIVLTQLNR